MSEATIGVAVLPPLKITLAIGDMAMKVGKKFPLSYEHNEAGPRPHVTMYQGVIADRDIAVHAIVGAVQQAWPGGLVTLRQLAHFGRGFLFCDCTVSVAFHQTHVAIVEALQPLVVQGPEPVPGNPPPGLTDDQARFGWKYGYPFAKNLFRPHITIGRLKAGDISPADMSDIHALIGKEMERLKGASFAPTEVVLYDIGIDGACVGIRERIPLPRP